MDECFTFVLRHLPLDPVFFGADRPVFLTHQSWMFGPPTEAQSDWFPHPSDQLRHWPGPDRTTLDARGRSQGRPVPSRLEGRGLPAGCGGGVGEVCDPSGGDHGPAEEGGDRIKGRIIDHSWIGRVKESATTRPGPPRPGPASASRPRLGRLTSVLPLNLSSRSWPTISAGQGEQGHTETIIREMRN